jgi:hypothetical protein
VGGRAREGDQPARPREHPEDGAQVDAGVGRVVGDEAELGLPGRRPARRRGPGGRRRRPGCRRRRTPRRASGPRGGR